MSNITQSIKSFKVIYPQVYSYILPKRQQTEGSQKIGYTEKKNVDVRIRQQVRTAAFNEEYEKLWSAPAFFEGNIDSFTDKTFHRFLEKKGIERKVELGREWFYFNGEPLKSKDLFDIFRKENFAALQNDEGKIEYTLRFEQEEAVKMAIDYFQKNERGEFLWNAKPRFGKTLASYDLAKRLKANKVLIVTNRPAIGNSWFDDFERFLEGYAFISETASLRNNATLTREQHIAITPIKPLITFLSLQDIKGSKYFGGNFDKLKWVADLEWDLLIIDEAHEGIETWRTDKAFDVIKRKNTLHLSGTPFKALANLKFSNDAIYNWTYLDEQKIKQVEIEEGEIGEHTDLPDLKLFTYRISQMITEQVNEGIEIENETRDYAFDLNEFFRAKDKTFVYENDVKAFLKNLTTNKKYPFSTPELREELRHTFWFVGNRVESVKALEKLLKEDPIFKDYKVVVAAGDGRTFEEEENDLKANETSFKRVKDAIAENDKTITLSCGQLTTGVTIKEWSAVLMLTDIKTPSLYMQAAFRAQNPYKEWRNNELVCKKSAYLFDFAPTRVLEIYDHFANGLNPLAVNGEINDRDREKKIQELLNFFPVISEDVNGEMIELDAQKVLTFPNALAAIEIVNARFMTNLLFNDSLKGVFNFPKEVENILDKMSTVKNKRVQRLQSPLDLDDAKTTNTNKTNEINRNAGIILGERIFRVNTERIVDNLLEGNNENILAEQLAEKVAQAAEPLIAKYKEVYKATQAETKEVGKHIEDKVKQIAEEYNNAEIDRDTLKQKIAEAIEVDFVINKVAQKENERVEKVQKTKEEEIRDRLRSFTRTIPMFVMANASMEEITIDNFDLEVDDQDFLELTSITKEEFHKLRDGFDYEEDGERKAFQGVFHKYRFNASIAEFRRKKEEFANYFTAEEDIFELIPNQKTNQIFTPKKVVQMMINKLEEHDPLLFTRTDSTFIDLYMKSGMYITEIVKRLFSNTRNQYQSDYDCLKHILENQVYGLAPTPILQGITQSYIFGFDVENKISRKNFIQHDISPESKQGVAFKQTQKLFNLTENMKFDAVVGNPPYQESDGGAQASAIPIYHLFVQEAKKMMPHYVCMITPSRWFAGGRGLDSFRNEMLKDNRLRELHDFIRADELFHGVEIKGGVSYFIWNRESKGLCAVNTYINGKLESTCVRPLLEKNSDTFIRYNGAIPILHKVQAADEKTFNEIVSPQKPFGLRGFFEDYKDEPFHDSIKIYANQKIGYVREEQIPNRKDWVYKFKLFVPRNIGVGSMERDFIKPILGEKSSCCTETYIVFGPFENKSDAENAMGYVQTKFFHFMVGLKKISQGISKKVFEFVPLQDFTQNSSLVWSTKSISDIDRQLYEKYKLSTEEIAFIEESVQTIE